MKKARFFLPIILFSIMLLITISISTRAATSSTTTYTSRTFCTSLEDNWTITGN